jgi:hypothetical protein
MTHEEKKQTLVNLVNDNVVPPEIRAEWMKGKTESEAFLLVLDYLFPETEQGQNVEISGCHFPSSVSLEFNARFPKWKSFDRLPDEKSTCICAKSGLAIYHGEVFTDRFGKRYLEDDMGEVFYITAFDGWMYEEEFQKLINLGL